MKHIKILILNLFLTVITCLLFTFYQHPQKKENKISVAEINNKSIFLSDIDSIASNELNIIRKRFIYFELLYKLATIDAQHQGIKEFDILKLIALKKQPIQNNYFDLKIRINKYIDSMLLLNNDFEYKLLRNKNFIGKVEEISQSLIVSEKNNVEIIVLFDYNCDMCLKSNKQKINILDQYFEYLNIIFLPIGFDFDIRHITTYAAIKKNESFRVYKALSSNDKSIFSSFDLWVSKNIKNPKAFTNQYSYSKLAFEFNFITSSLMLRGINSVPQIILNGTLLPHDISEVEFEKLILYEILKQV